MKKFALATLLALAAIPGAALAGFGYFATNGAFTVINTNGGGNSFYYFQAGSANSPLQGTNLGTFNPGLGNTLILNGGETQTFENGGDNVLGSTIWYRVFPTASPSGNFTSVALSNLTLLGGGDEKRNATAANVNPLSALPNGNYTLQVFAEATVDYNLQAGGGPKDVIRPNPAGGTFFNSSGGNQGLISSRNATFSVIPEPAGCALFVTGLLGMLARRKRR